ncbi:MAG: shikimate dehydrogenase family protein [Actinomycetota bacterium]
MTSSESDLMLFIGVTTGGSSIMRLFPRWAAALGLDAGLEGRDLPIGAAAEVYRSAVEEIRDDDRIRGALVTTHKVDVYRHAADLFDDLDDNARLCREVSSISKLGRKLIGHAKDPITAGRALERILDGRPPPPEVLCLGAGGAGTAISVYLVRHPQPPRRLLVTDREEDRIDALRTICDEAGGGEVVEAHIAATPIDNDELLGSLDDRALVVNATGMGKDTPGSPLSDDAPYPRGAMIWELNYRGDLDFLEQAAQRRDERRLELHDGWIYFLHGWSEVISEVFDVQMDDARFDRLGGVAEDFRPSGT